MALAIAEVQTPTRLAISASEIPYSRLKIQPILPRTRETACLWPPIPRKACGPAEKEEMDVLCEALDYVKLKVWNFSFPFISAIRTVIHCT